MTIRSELEKKVVEYAASRSLAVAMEGCPFDRTNVSEYLEVFFLKKAIFARDVAVQGKTTRGMMQINVCVKDGTGSKRVEELAEAIAALYPVANKQAFPTVSIEQHPQIGPAFIDAKFRIVPITVEYRQEL